MNLIARHLEENNIPTVVIGSGLDIVEHCGVPRFLFTDFPLGNPCGHPWARYMQRAIVAQALDLLESAVAPRTAVQAPFAWKDDPGWRARYSRVEPEDLDPSAALGEERRRQRARLKSKPASHFLGRHSI